MRPITIKLSPSAANAANIAASQTPGAAGNLTLTALASSGLEMARILLLTTNADETSKSFVVTGTDADGSVISETVTGVSSSTAVTVNAYKTVTSIHVSAATTAAITWGTRGTTLVGNSATIPLNFYERTPATIAIEISGTANVSIIETFDDVLGSVTGANATFMAAQTGLTSQSSTTNSTLTTNCTGIRVQLNSYSTGAVVTTRIIHTLNYGA